jgi:Ca-activated chloride channel family protein
MRIRSFAAMATIAMALSAAGSWALSAPSPIGKHQPGPVASSPSPVPSAAPDVSRFVDGKTLLLDGRLGQASIARTDSAPSTETFVLATVTGAEAPATIARTPPVHLAILVDRSGSMAGTKMRNAILAAVGAVERMREGDRATVIAFDTMARVLVAPTVLDAPSRPRVEAAIRAMQPGGDTCISCALETATTVLDASPGAADEVRRVLLISDGEATTGVRDVAGLRALASRVGVHGSSVSTIGVDLAFDEKVMAAIAQEANGKHFFVPDASALQGVFQEELGALESTVASGAELTIEPAPGVVLEDVLDRPFRRVGGRLVVQLGSFDPKQEKTVLLRARVPSDQDGAVKVARMTLAYRDLAQELDGHCGGNLELEVRSDGTAQRDIDPFVAARVERSLTARTLTEANDLFKLGKDEDARRKLAERQQELAQVAGHARVSPKATTTPAFGRSLDADFHQQESALAQAQAGFAPPPPAATLGVLGGHGMGSGGAGAPASAPAAKSAVRSNQANAVEMGF